MCGPDKPAAPAIPSPRHPHRRCRRRVAALHPPYSRICWSRNTAIICRCIGNARFTPRQGLELNRSTPCDWVGQSAWLLDLIVAAIRAHVFAAQNIHDNDTTVPVLSPGLGRTKTGRLLAYVRDDRPFCGGAPPAVAYFYSPDRTSAHPAAHLTGFTGLLQPDAYTGFDKLCGPARTKPVPIMEVASWAHTRRGCSITGSNTNPQRPNRRWIGAPRSMPSKLARPVLPSPSGSDGTTNWPLVWTTFFSGPKPRSQSCRRRLHWLRRSATRSIGAKDCRDQSPTDALRSTITSPRMPCAPLPLAERTTCSQAQIPAASRPYHLHPRLTAKLNGVTPRRISATH